MIQSLKEWFKKPYDENAKKIVRDYTKRRFRVVFWMFILVVLLIIASELDKRFNISEFLGIPCESIYTEDKCNKWKNSTKWNGNYF